jgi:hypothetical protein
MEGRIPVGQPASGFLRRLSVDIPDKILRALVGDANMRAYGGTTLPSAELVTADAVVIALAREDIRAHIQQHLEEYQARFSLSEQTGHSPAIVVASVHILRRGALEAWRVGDAIPARLEWDASGPRASLHLGEGDVRVDIGQLPVLGARLIRPKWNRTTGTYGFLDDG